MSSSFEQPGLKMAVTNHNTEEKMDQPTSEHSPDGSTKDKAFVAHEETFHNAAERGHAATDQ